jgi:hypothetical protein
LGNLRDGHALQQSLDGPNPQFVSGVRCFLHTSVVEKKQPKGKSMLQNFCRGPRVPCPFLSL